MKKGKLYFGVCEGCYTKDSATEYENKIRTTADELAMQKSVKALVENFRDELSGGERVLLADVFDIVSKKPLRKSQSEKHRKSKESRFNDFLAFIKGRHPDVILVRDVTPRIAEEYISYIRANGRFSKLVTSPTGQYHSNIRELSPATLNRILEELKGYFEVLMKQCGMVDNPFADIPPVVEEVETREAFSESELEQILSEAPDFIRDIFIRFWFMFVFPYKGKAADFTAAAIANDLLPAVLGLGKFLVELVDAAIGLDVALLPGVEGMAVAACFDLDFLKDASGLERVPAADAGHRALVVLGMDAFLHVSLLSALWASPTKRVAVKMIQAEIDFFNGKGAQRGPCRFQIETS